MPLPTCPAILIHRMHVLPAAALALLALGGSALPVSAQTCFASPSYPSMGPLALRLPASTRMLAMGNADVAGRDDDVVFYGPAQIGVARGTSASVERYTPHAVAGAASTVTRLGSGGVAFGVSAVEYDALPCTAGADVTDFASGGGAIGASALVAVGVAQAVRGFRVGITGKYASDLLRNARWGAPLADVGLARDVSLFGDAPFTAAFAVQDIGRDMQPADTRVHPPTRATIGLAGGGPAGDFDIGITTALSVRRDGFVAPAGGVEVGWVWIEGYALVARAGARRPDAGEGPLTFGAGLNADRVSVDYALDTRGGGHVAHRLGLRIR